MNGAVDFAPHAGRTAIAVHFRERVPALIAAWSARVAGDPAISAGAALPRTLLEDHMPQWLASFADVLGEPVPAAGDHASNGEPSHDAEAHGLQRWQQGYDLPEVTREWGCLHRCLVLELEAFATSHGDALPADLAEARLKLAERISAATSLSTESYFRLERLEAAGSVLDLEKAVKTLRTLEAARGELWQQAAHDLRGNLGVVSQAAEGLNLQGVDVERRQHVLDILRSNVAALRSLLDDVTGLARLQAGQEQREVHRFDAAELLRLLCDEVRPLADAKGLYLLTQGDTTLQVDGDPVKVRRIVQNLLLNALKYTRRGHVVVTWGAGGEGDDDRWSLEVIDTGPGFHAGPGAPLASALSAATGQSQNGSGHGEAPPAALPDSRAVNQVSGEGLGLAIVKRLCELLDATIELDTAPEEGSTFRILLPRRYPGLNA